MFVINITKSKVHIFLVAVLTGFSYYFLAKLGIYLSSPPEYIATFWPANAVVLSALLLVERRYWWMFLLAVLPAITFPNFYAGYSIARAIIFYIANCVEILLAASFLKHILGNIHFDRLHDMIMFILIAVLIAPLTSAFIASTTTFFEPEKQFWDVWRIWFLADGLGQLTLTPVIITTITSGITFIKNISLIRIIESIALALSIVLISELSLGTQIEGFSPALLYTPVPILLWAALRFGAQGLCTSTLTITVIAIYSAINGAGPFTERTTQENVLSLQLFLLAVSVPMMLLSSLYSERKQTEKELNKTNRQIKTITDSSAAVVYTLTPTELSERPFEITYMSENIEQLTGYEASLWLTDKTFWIDHVHPEDREKAFANQEVLLKKGELTHDYRFLCKDGTYAWIHDKLLTIKDEKGKITEIVGAWISITEQKKSEEALKESEARFRSIFEQAAVGVALIESKTGKFIRINQSYCNMIGYSKEEMLENKTFQQITHPDDLKADLENMKLLMSDIIREYSLEKRYYHKNGSTVWVNLTVSPTWKTGEEPKYHIAVVENITSRKQAHEQLNYQACHDSLTGLVNRREFERRAERLLATVATDNGEHALCFMDLDQFKVVNDTCGHNAGDEMLRQITSKLQEIVRKRDTLARLGGDEFGVLMEHCSLDDAHRVATSLLKAIQDFHFIWEDHTFKIGVSIGLVTISEVTTNLTELLKDADSACYMAKESGRNRIQIHQADDSETAKRHGEMQWVTRIHKALEENRLCLYAQLIEPLYKNTNKHYEILVRMIDEKNMIIPPGAFLPAAERYNVISKIDYWVIKNTFEVLTNNPIFLKQINFCSINLSGQSITATEIMEFIIEQLNSSGIEGRKICFEITETAVISNLNKAIKFITTLRELGCRFALDDFGSGLSSFAYLKNLPVDYVKIDGVFVKDIVDDPIDHAMVKSINEIAQVMGMKTIAEFVENDLIKGMLREIGVNYAQGYGVEKPVPFSTLLNRTDNIVNIKD